MFEQSLDEYLEESDFELLCAFRWKDDGEIYFNEFIRQIREQNEELKSLRKAYKATNDDWKRLNNIK